MSVVIFDLIKARAEHRCPLNLLYEIMNQTSCITRQQFLKLSALATSAALPPQLDALCGPAQKKSVCNCTPCVT